MNTKQLKALLTYCDPHGHRGKDIHVVPREGKALATNGAELVIIDGLKREDADPYTVCPRAVAAQVKGAKASATHDVSGLPRNASPFPDYRSILPTGKDHSPLTRCAHMRGRICLCCCAALPLSLGR